MEKNLQVQERYFLRSYDKLKSRKAIEKLFAQGFHFSQYPFKITWLPQNGNEHLQVGVGVSSRQFKKAVDRNKIKRLMREAWRLQKNELKSLLVQSDKRLSVFIIFTGKAIPPYELVHQKIGSAIERLKTKMNEAT